MIFDFVFRMKNYSNIPAKNVTISETFIVNKKRYKSIIHKNMYFSPQKITQMILHSSFGTKAENIFDAIKAKEILLEIIIDYYGEDVKKKYQYYAKLKFSHDTRNFSILEERGT